MSSSSFDTRAGDGSSSMVRDDAIELEAVADIAVDGGGAEVNVSEAEVALPLVASLPPELFECVCLSCSLQAVGRLACTSKRLRTMSYRGDLPLIAANKKVDGGKVLYSGHDGKVVLARWAADHGASAAVVTALLGAHGTVEAWTFCKCEALKSITIPEPVQAISENAFYGCTALESVTIPASVQTIGYYAFSRCKALESISIPEPVKRIGGGAFANCTALKSVSLPASVQTIGMGAFTSCHALESITIPASVQTLGMGAFLGCAELKSITLPQSLEDQMKDAYLTTIHKPDLSVTFT